MRRLDPTALILCLAMLPTLGDFSRDVAMPAWEMLERVAGRARRPSGRAMRRVHAPAIAALVPDGGGLALPASSADGAR